MKKLGFGLMRLPHPDPGDWSKVDMEQVKQMIDEYMAAGKTKHIGFSYHDDAETLDMILTEHPEVELW